MNDAPNDPDVNQMMAVFDKLSRQADTAKDEMAMAVNSFVGRAQDIIIAKRAEIAQLRAQLAERDATIARLRRNINECDGEIEALRAQLAKRDALIAQFRADIANRDEELARLNSVFSVMKYGVAQ